MEKIKIFILIAVFHFIFIGLVFSQDTNSIQDADIISNAIAMGDMETLYNFLQNPEGKDRALINSAANALRRYTGNDTAAASYRTNRMDPRVNSVGASLMENLFHDPAAHLPAVTAKLTSGITNQFAKVKVINDWICHNIDYDTDHYFGIRYSQQDFVSVIKNKKAVCSGYAALFREMCRLASVECITISGFSKGAGYDGYIGSAPDHDWNAVKIGTKWYLVDVTWNAGRLDYRSYIRSYSTSYLFLDSRAFLYSHLPLENKYQFYAPVVTKEQFMAEPYIAGEFFRYGLEFKNDSLRYNNQINGSLQVEFTIRNQSVMFLCDLRTQGQQKVPGGYFMQRSGNNITFIFDVPDTGNYMGHIFAVFNNERQIVDRIPVHRYETRIIPLLDELVQNRRITEREKEHFINSYYKIDYNGYYYYYREDLFDTARINAVTKIHPLVNLSMSMFNHILNFNIKAAEGYTGYSPEFSQRYPDATEHFVSVQNTKLLSPINGSLASGTTQKFEISSRDFTRIYAVINRRNVYFSRNAEGNFELEIEIPQDIDQITITGIRGNTYYPILIYNVR